MNERIVLGLGGTVDYEIDWDDAVVQAWAASVGPGARRRNIDLALGSAARPAGPWPRVTSCPSVWQPMRCWTSRPRCPS